MDNIGFPPIDIRSNLLKEILILAAAGPNFWYYTPIRACAVNYSHNVTILVISLGNFGISKEKIKKTIIYFIKTANNNTDGFVSESRKRSK